MTNSFAVVFKTNTALMNEAFPTTIARLFAMSFIKFVKKMTESIT